MVFNASYCIFDLWNFDFKTLQTMSTLIKSATIIDRSSPFNNQQKDILITNGVIQQIETSITVKPEYKVVELENLHVSRGWFDTSVSFGEPGFEERENIGNGLNTAAKSGFTAVAVNSNTMPVVDNKSAVEFLINKAANFATKLYPIASLTQKSEGKEMAEESKELKEKKKDQEKDEAEIKAITDRIHSNLEKINTEMNKIKGGLL